MVEAEELRAILTRIDRDRAVTERLLAETKLFGRREEMKIVKVAAAVALATAAILNLEHIPHLFSGRG
jgi:hypothetical protein